MSETPGHDYNYDQDFNYALWEEYMVLVDAGKPLEEAMAEYLDDMSQASS